MLTPSHSPVGFHHSAGLDVNAALRLGQNTRIKLDIGPIVMCYSVITNKYITNSVT